jgi:hypothetical protein
MPATLDQPGFNISSSYVRNKVLIVHHVYHNDLQFDKTASARYVKGRDTIATARFLADNVLITYGLEPV